MGSKKEIITKSDYQNLHNFYGKKVTGIVVRVNQKTLTVKTDQGMWRVHPEALKKLDSGGTPLNKLFPDKLDGSIFN